MPWTNEVNVAGAPVHRYILLWNISHSCIYAAPQPGYWPHFQDTGWELFRSFSLSCFCGLGVNWSTQGRDILLLTHTIPIHTRRTEAANMKLVR